MEQVNDPESDGRQRGNTTSSKQPPKQSTLISVREVPQYVRSHSDSFSDPLYLSETDLSALRTNRNSTKSHLKVQTPLNINQVDNYHASGRAQDTCSITASDHDDSIVSNSGTLQSSTQRTSGCCRFRSSEYEPKRSWFMLFFSIIPINTLFGMNFMTFGLYYIEYVDYFQTTTSVVGVIASLRFGVMSFFGIMTSSFLKRYPSRMISMCGGSVMVAACIINSLAPSVYLLYLSQGVLEGIGGSLLTMTSSVLIQQHFHKNRALGGGLGMMGLSLGYLIGPPLVNLLIQTYGWRGSQLITSALFGNIIALSATLWQPSELYRVQVTSEVINDGTSENKEIQQVSVPDDTAPNSIDTKVDDGAVINDSSASSHKSNICVDFCKDIFNFSYLKNLKFTLLCISGAMSRYNSRTFLELGPSKSVSLGMSRSEAAAVISIFSMVGMGARVFSTFLTNLKFVNKILYFGSGVMFGTVGNLLTLWHTFPGQAIAGVLQGIHTSFTNTISSVIIVDMMGIEHLGKCMALFNMFVGSISMCASPLGGYLYDVTGNFDIPFLVAAVASFIAALILFGIGIAYERTRKLHKRTGDLPNVVNKNA